MKQMKRIHKKALIPAAILLSAAFTGYSLPLAAQQDSIPGTDTTAVTRHETAQESDIAKYRELVYRYSHDIKKSHLEMMSAGESVKTAKADFLPKVSANADVNYTGHPAELTLDLPSPVGTVNFSGNHFRYGISGSVYQPVYMGGALSEKFRIAETENEMSRLQNELVLSEISYEADLRYWTAVARLELAAVADSFMQSVSQLTETIRNRVETDYSDRSDLLMAEVKLNEAEYMLMQAKNDCEVARMSLNSLAGIPSCDTIHTDTAIPAETDSREAVYPHDFNCSTHPAIMLAEKGIEVSKRTGKLEDSEFLPQLYTGIQGSYSSPGYDFKADPDLNYAVYAKLDIPIFEWGKRRSTRKANQYKTEAAASKRDKLTDEINLQIQSAWYSYAESVEKVNLTANSLLKAEENMNIAEERYREGEISVVEVLDAQIYRYQAMYNHITSKLNAKIYKAALTRALGRNSFGNMDEEKSQTI